MNWAHVHLLLNHIPVLGTVFGTLLLVFGMAKKNEEIKRVSLGVFVIIAVATLPVYFTGEPTEEIVEHLPGVAEPIIEEHEEAALVSLIAVGILGILALIVLWRSRHADTLPKGYVTLALILAIVVSALMAWTADLGGKIRHSEIRSEMNSALPMTEADDDD
jgi:uncharacterized membrane protein